MPSIASTSASAASSPQTAQKRFSTTTGLDLTSPNSNRASVMGLFETPLIPPQGGLNGASSTKKADRSLLPGFSSKAGAMGREDGPWSVSVADTASNAEEFKRESRKKQKAISMQTYTLYVTTPTHNLTLLRSSADIVALNSKLRDNHPSPSSLPSLPQLPVSHQPASRKLLQTISRTLSPGINRSRTPLTPLTAPSPNVNESTASSTSDSKKESPAPSTPLSPASEEPKAFSSTSHTITTQLATYLTSLSNNPAVKKQKSWIRFIKVGSDDLESIRVERRVRKVRSDLAQHVKSSVAPTNTNVGATPSQSDIGEEGMRTTDDDRSLSGQSTSASQRRRDKPDVPSRSTSVAQDRTQREEREANRKGFNFAGIPEELEREKRSSLEEQKYDEDKEENARRERKHRRQHLPREAEKVTVDDFDMIRVLGKGCAGKVLLVRHLATKGLFAMKSIHKRHVLAHQELQHTLTEQAVLKKMAKEVMDPFVVRLWWSFHDKNNLYLVMDFHPGGDLATQLSRWGRLGRDRARFYAAEIVEGVEGLHRAGVIYRDLKPENVLIASDGHIVLSDFGLSKEFPTRGNIGTSTPPTSPNRSHSSNNVNQQTLHWLSASEDNRKSEATTSMSNSTGLDTYPSKGSRNLWSDERDMTTTFCGTAEYLAPEVIQGAAYSYEVDWWSFGTMLYEMLTGITPFWADTHADMYVRVLHDELVFPDDRVLDQDTKSILRGLLQRNPMLRMKEPRIKKHPYFSMIEWAHVFHKRYIPPYIPPINPLDETDTQNFDEAFLDMQPVINGAEDEVEEAEEEAGDATAVSNGAEAFPKNGEGLVVASDHKAELKDSADVKSLFDGYSFRGRRESGSIKSSIISASAPSDDQIAQRGPISSTLAKAVVSSTSTTQPAIATTSTPLSSSPTPVIKPTPIVAAAIQNNVLEAEEDDEEDYDEAARAAVAALDHLEREAALAEEMLSSQSQTSASSPPTSTATSQAMRDSIDESVASSITPSANPSKVRMAANISASGLEAPIEELNDEVEEDWDMIDVPSAGEAAPTETNGGKGQNLFAKGVVDTYRMLRRQESIRMTSSPSYGSGSINRSFNRLSRRNRSSKRNLRPDSQDNIGNDSATSLSRSSAYEGGGGVGTDERMTEMERESRIGGPSPLPSSSVIGSIGEDMNTIQKGTNGNSPSLASSEDVASQERSKQKIKKIKRFSSFFENSR